MFATQWKTHRDCAEYWAMKRDALVQPVLIVHVLKHGLPRCRFTTALPVEWPPHHKWAREGDPAANCPNCLKVTA